jgi:tRNA pseudouridine55 synthase
MDGLLVVDKPPGPTSHDVVARMRRVLGERRIGHTGTLDPAATGVLPLVIGRATRLAQFLSGRDKEYEAVICLGVATTTCDAEGEPIGPPSTGPWPGREEIEQALATFRGTFDQRPPAFSAKKIAGQRSSRLARRRAVSSDAEAHAHSEPASALLRPVTVTVHTLDLVGAEADRVTLRLSCSAGFYVRSLAHDLGQRLGIGAHLAALRRTRSGEYGVDAAVPLAELERDPAAARAAIIPPERMLGGWDTVVLTDAGLVRATQGRDLGPADAEHPAEMPSASRVRLLATTGRLVGVAEPSSTPGFLHAVVVFV